MTFSSPKDEALVSGPPTIPTMLEWICGHSGHELLNLTRVKVAHRTATPDSRYSCLCGTEDRGPVVHVLSMRCRCGTVIPRSEWGDPRAPRQSPRMWEREECPSCGRRFVGRYARGAVPPPAFAPTLVRLWDRITARHRRRAVWRTLRGWQ